MFFFLRDNWMTLLFMKVYRYSEIFVSTILPAFFEASVLKKVRILCVISAITIPDFQNKADCPS